MRRMTKLMWAPMIVAALCAPFAQAQQQQTPPPPTSPVPTGSSQQSGQSTQLPASPVQSASTTVTGGLAPTVGDSGDIHSQITAGLTFSELFDSNFQDASGTTGWDALSTIGGNFALRRTGATTDFVVHYTGGGYIDAQNSANDSSYHQFEVSETLQFRRWTLTLDDLFNYLPDSSFGFGGAGGGLGITLLNPFLPPSQTILTNTGQRLGNTALAQVQYEASPRSAWTFSANYGLLHFITPGYLDTSNTTISAGYNYSFSARDVLGVSYAFSAFRFSPDIESINSNVVQVTYGRHISNHLMFQAGAGPQLYTVTNLLGPNTGLQTSWSANASLTYQLGHTSLAGSFTHGVSGGSGILTGATTTVATFSASRQFGQWTTLNGSLGYSVNNSLQGTILTAVAYDGLYATAGINRQLSKSFSVNANYTFLRQGTNSGACVGTACADPFLRHQIWVGVTWNMRPIPLR
jgi:hypothetical protein